MKHALAYLEKGKGKAVVLLHGFCERKELWNDTLGTISQVAYGLAPDLPGFGDNPPVTAPVSIESMADSVHDWLQHLDITQGILVGHSLGGYLSLAFAEKYPDWVKGLCLFHSTAKADPEEKKQNRTQTVDFLEKNGMNPFAGPFVERLFFQPDRPDLQATVEQLKDVVVATPVDTAIEVTKAMRDRPDRTHVLVNASFPVLFIAGREDQSVPLSTLHDQFLLPPSSVTVQVLPNTAHMGMYERKGEALQTLRSFVEQITSPGL